MLSNLTWANPSKLTCSILAWPNLYLLSKKNSKIKLNLSLNYLSLLSNSLSFFISSLSMLKLIFPSLNLFSKKAWFIAQIWFMHFDYIYILYVFPWIWFIAELRTYLRSWVLCASKNTHEPNFKDLKHK